MSTYAIACGAASEEAPVAALDAAVGGAADGDAWVEEQTRAGHDAALTATSAEGGVIARASDARVAQPEAQAGDHDAAPDAHAVPATTPADSGWPLLERAQVGKPVLIAQGFSLAEGPLWDHCAQVLRFTDVDPSRMHQLVPPMTVSVSQEKTNYTNGITYHPSGDLLRAEMGGNGVGKITRVDAAGVVTVIADKNANGEPLHTPDDLVVRSDGTIYFTDPTFAHGPALGDSLFDRPVYRITPAALGQRVILEDAMPSPNGVELTRDEKTLYVASYLDEIVYAYPVAADGALGPRKVFARAIDDADSMCLDAADNLYVGASSGLRIIRADGTALGNIPMPSGDKVTNCEFGGGDGKTLYITARKTLWRIDAMPIFGLQWEKHRSLPCAK